GFPLRERNFSSARSDSWSFRPRNETRSARLLTQLLITLPFSNSLMTSGQTYELRHTAGVLPNTSAVSLIAATMRRLRTRACVRNVDSGGISIPARASAHAQTSVPAHVRKSFALKLPP